MTNAGWPASLELDFAREGERSVLRRRRHTGPLRVQRVFHPEGDAAHVYLLHPPGGVVGGDVLDVSIRVCTGASAVITTPAAQKIYRSAGRESRQGVSLEVEAGGSLEWLPAETIAFDGARARSHVRVDLEAGARFIGWEMGCFGRPASALPFRTGRLDFGFELYRDGAPTLVERQIVEGGSPCLDEPWGYGGFPVWGALYGASADTAAAGEFATELREVCGRPDNLRRAAATSMDGIVCIRVGAISVQAARELLVACWQLLRPRLIGREAVSPRIWAT